MAVKAMFLSLFAVCTGAALGAALRWLAAVALNPLLPYLPLGTLAVNLAGAYGIGLALSLFAFFPSLGASWRLFVITGFLGGLTTFSTFSAEVVSIIQEGRLTWAACVVALHVCGSLAMTVLGLQTIALARQFFR